MKNPKITFLGPVGATFSHDAYTALAERYKTPTVTDKNCLPASTNGEVLKIIQSHGGYGALAMETLAEGRVAEPLESFIELLQGDEPELHIVGSVQMKLHFCLMVRMGVLESEVVSVIAHPKALGACKKGVARMEKPTVSATSNGEAARLVAESDDHKLSAALGPRSAAEKYGLKVLHPEFEDSEAITTFFLIAPKKHNVAVGKNNRTLIVYKVPHQPGALVKSLLPFEQEGLNLIQIHSVHAGKGVYHFAIEIEVKESEMDAWKKAMKVFGGHVERHMAFGPFEVLSM